jgi:hypothetical protein
LGLGAWDAWDGARRDAGDDRRELRKRRRLGDGAGKWADRERDVRERSACRRLARQVELAARDAQALCTPGAARFAERSFVVQEPAEQRAWPLLAEQSSRRELLARTQREQSAAKPDESVQLWVLTERQAAPLLDLLERTQVLRASAEQLAVIRSLEPAEWQPGRRVEEQVQALFQPALAEAQPARVEEPGAEAALRQLPCAG